jgi:hypothetical protein
MGIRSGRWEAAGKSFVELWSPLDSQVVKLVPTEHPHSAESAAAAPCPRPPEAPPSLEALQVTVAAGDGSIHTLTLEISGARKLAQMIFNRLAEFGDPLAREVVSLLKDHDRSNIPLDDREAA